MKNLICINPGCNTELTGKQTKYCSRKCHNDCGNLALQSYPKQKERGVIRKIELLKLKGGACSECGYRKNIAVLEFHHIDADKKLSQLSMRRLSNTTWEFCLKEVEKCVVLCANCHRELHNPSLNDLLDQMRGNEDLSLSPHTQTKESRREKKISRDLDGPATRRTNAPAYQAACHCGNRKLKASLLCRACSNQSPKLSQRKCSRPSREELERLIWEKPMTTIANSFGVSNVAIKKWCVQYGILNFPGRGYWAKQKSGTVDRI